MMKRFGNLNILLLSFFVLFSCQRITKQEGLPDNHEKKITDVIIFLLKLLKI